MRSRGCALSAWSMMLLEVEDSIVISKFRRMDELSSFTKAVLALPHVKRTNTHVVLNTCKEDFRFPFYGLNLDPS